MGNIVIITTTGGAKKDLVNTIHETTNGAVSLVVVQKSKPDTVTHRIKKFIHKVGLLGLPREIFYFYQMHTNKKFHEAISFTKLRSPVSPSYNEYLPPTVFVDAINGQDVYERIKAAKPDIIVIWGGLIVKSRIIKLARKAVNMHMGYCPYYRGTNCNLNALLHNDFDHIGVTIHEVVSVVDAGAIYDVVTVDCRRKSPKQFFTELNDACFNRYVELIKKIHQGEELGTKKQDLTLGKNYMLKEWTYEKQYRVAQKLLELDTLYPIKDK